MLGTVSQITIGTSSAEESAKFYEKLGFEKVAESDQPNPWVQVADACNMVLLNEDNLQYIGLTYFNPELESLLPKLEEWGVNIVQNIQQDGQLFQLILADPNGILLSLINFDASKMHQPPRKSLLTLDPAYMQDFDQMPNPQLGVFGELSYPVTDLEASLKWWECLGFEALSVNEKPYPWAILSDKVNLLGLHQTDRFEQPAITYFSPEMQRRIAALKAQGLDNFEAFGNEDDPKNQSLVTPEGQRFFLFSL